MRVRQLVGDTFERIVIYQRGMQLEAKARSIDVVLHSHGGTARPLRIGAGGKLLSADEVNSETVVGQLPCA